MNKLEEAIEIIKTEDKELLERLRIMPVPQGTISTSNGPVTPEEPVVEAVVEEVKKTTKKKAEDAAVQE